MRKFIKLILLFTFVFYSFSCDDNPTENMDKGVNEFNNDVKKCGTLGKQDIGHGLYIMAVSKDKKTLIANFGSNGSVVILFLNGKQIISEKIVFPTSNSSNELEYTYSINYPMFCPYDQNEIIFMSSFKDKIIDETGYSTDIFVPIWCRYNLKTKILSNLIVKNLEISEFLKKSYHRNIVHWSSKSSPGNDIFYLGNFKKLSLQSEQISESGFQKPISDTSLRLLLVSPDEKKYFSSLSMNDLYLNNHLINKEVTISEFDSPWGIHWSDDSRYFSTQVPIDDYEPVIMVRSPAVYRINEDNSVILEMSYNMLKKHCSNPNSFPGSPVFISDTSYLYCMYPKLGYFGDLYEFNKKGDVIKRITNFFD